MFDVLRRADLDFNRDIRPEIARTLHGQTVWFPETNPAPPPSRRRAGLNSRARAKSAISQMIRDQQDRCR